MPKFMGILRKIKPGDAGEPRIEYAGWKLSATLGPVDFYDLVVPAGALVAHVPVSAGSHCIVVEHDGKRYHFMVSSAGLTDPDVIEPVPPERCRPLI